MDTLASDDFRGMATNGSGCSPTNETTNETTTSTDAIYYFGYGPIVNPLVRYRRGCTLPQANVRTAILYDHRLSFVEGGTATIVPARGWDVKGVLLKFDSVEDWETFRHFGAGYDEWEVSVSVIDQAHPDPANKNSRTFPLESCGEHEHHEVDTDDDDEHDTFNSRGPNQGPISSRYSYGDDDDEGSCSSSDEEYSCPFSIGSEAKCQREDPNAVRCRTFSMGSASSSSPPPRISTCSSSNGSTANDSVFCKPQERYLELMKDGLRAHEVDETYIRDEVLAVDYIPNLRDKVVDYHYRTFPLATKPTKLPKISLAKYESKLCGSTSSKNNNKRRDNQQPGATYFVCNHKVLRVDAPPEGDHSTHHNENACVKWLRALGHGRGDITLLVHQTFVDPQCVHVPLVDTVEDLTPAHYEWAEHTVLLYLERGGLTATVVYELTDTNANSTSGNNRAHKRSISTSIMEVGKSVPLLVGRRFRNRTGSSGAANVVDSANSEHPRRSSVPLGTVSTTTTLEDDRFSSAMKAKSKRFSIPRLKNLRSSKGMAYAPGA